MSHDRYSDWDGAYVLGALSPAERHEYEQHLAGCPGCGAAVRELAGIPGLLARTRDLGTQATGALPSLAAQVTAVRPRRPRRLTSLAAAAAVAAAAVLASTLGTRDTGEEPGSAPLQSRVVASVGPGEGLAFTPVDGASASGAPTYSVRAVLVDRADGALVLLRCEALTSASYGTGRGGIHRSQDVPDLELWSVDGSGARQLRRWAPRPVGQVVQASATSPVPTARLGTLEVRALGKAVLRLEVSPR